MGDSKSDEHLEGVKQVEHLGATELALPSELAGLDRSELLVLEKQTVRRLDCFLMPAVFILFLLNILDRNNIASAKIVGLTETLGTTNAEYNTCLMSFYVGYIITELPANVLITRTKPSIVIGFVTAAWGVVSMCQGFTKNFGQLLATRIVLGLVEGPFLPAVFLLMSCWYTRAELPPRIAVLYAANILGNCFGGLIGAGITSQMQNTGGRPAWEWLFIIEGSMTIVIAILVIPFIPDYPLHTKRWWLTDQHQALVAWRIQNENAGVVDEDPESLLWGVKEALIDPKLYMFVILQMSLITSESFNNFFPSIVGTLGYNSTITLLLTSPPWFFALLCSLLLSFHAAKKGERGYHIAIPLLFAIPGNLIAMFAPTLGARYFAMFLMTAGTYSPYNVAVSWLSSTLPRPRAKRAAAFAIVNLMGAGGSHLYTAYMFPDNQKPRYYAGGGVMTGACIVCAGMALGIKRHLKRQNRLIEEAEERRGEMAGGAIRAAKEGHGGQATLRFRYVH